MPHALTTEDTENHGESGYWISGYWIEGKRLIETDGD
jgi:hypothetical protein